MKNTNSNFTHDINAIYAVAQSEKILYDLPFNQLLTKN